jgi:REP element-mobilizing transposase RayT
MPEQKTYYRRHLPHYQPEGETFHVIFRLAGSIAVSVLEEFQRERYGVQANGVKNETARLIFLRRYRGRYLERIEAMLDGGTRGPFWLNKPEIAAIVNEAIRYRDEDEYDLIAHTIMPNHVHIIITNVRQQNRIGPVSRTACPPCFSFWRNWPKANTMSVGSPTRRPAGRDSVQDEISSVSRTDCPTDKPEKMDLSTDNPETEAPHAAYFNYPLSNVLRKLKWNTALRANRILGRTGPLWHPESYDRVIRNAAELERTIWYVLMNPVKAGLCKDWRDWKWSYVKKGYINQ